MKDDYDPDQSDLLVEELVKLLAVYGLRSQEVEFFLKQFKEDEGLHNLLESVCEIKEQMDEGLVIM